MSVRNGSQDSKSFGPYELLEKVGVGGMGSVFKARLKGKEEFVALKIANRAVAGDPVLLQRFQNEFKIASQLQHPNLARFLGYAVENNTPYLVMEFVPGQSLDKRLKSQGPMSLPSALATMGQVASALDFIHQKNLVHRDIKPGNILIDPGGQAKLADLGLAKNLDSHSLLTHSGTGLGTLEYAAPEQFDNAKNVDRRSDIYGLAATMYVALSGKFPFGHGSQMRILMHKLDHQFTPLSQLIEGVSPALDQVIIRSLHPDPTIRPASIPEFLSAMWSKDPPVTILMPKPLPEESVTPRKPRNKPLENAAKVNSPEVASRKQERRSGGTRHAIQIVATLSVANALHQESWSAQIVDISPGGLCLQIHRRFEPSTLLNVFLPEEKTGQPTPHLVRTCWIKALPDKTWLLGCHFVSPLEKEDLDQFLIGDLCKTNMLRQPKVAHGPPRHHSS
ncbi:MAG TPA: serine/threonine-protein kinase [Gemmataceae bacterium]|nr:serine/threonine-protein kinase [Gemmataceae bacterium]